MISDCWRAEERGKAVAIYSLAPFIGPVVGPIGEHQPVDTRIIGLTAFPCSWWSGHRAYDMGEQPNFSVRFFLSAHISSSVGSSGLYRLPTSSSRFWPPFGYLKHMLRLFWQRRQRNSASLPATRSCAPSGRIQITALQRSSARIWCAHSSCSAPNLRYRSWLSSAPISTASCTLCT